MGVLLNYPKFMALDDSGVPLVGGKVHTYIAGTTTNKATYSDKNLSTANANPVVLDRRGEAVIYGSGTYKIVLKDSNSNTIWSIDDIELSPTGAYQFYPNPDEADQAATSTGGSVKDILTSIGTSKKAEIIFLHNGVSNTTTYTTSQNADWSAYTNAKFILKNGAIISHGAFTLILPDTPDAGRYQIFSGSGAVTGLKVAYPEWFGALGDGSTDDYTAFTLAKACFPDTQTGFRRGTILLEDEVSYAIGTTFVRPNNISIIGKSWNSKILSKVTSGPCIKTIQTTWSNETARRGGTLKDFTIQWSSGASDGGLFVESGGHIEDDNIQIVGFVASGQYGRSFGTGPVVEYQSRRVYCNGNWYGTYIPSTASITTANFHGDSHRGNERHGFYISATPFVGLTFSGRCVFESNGASGFLYEGGANADGLDLGDSYFENNNASVAGKQCDIQGTGAFYIYNVCMKNAKFSTPGAAATGSFVYNYIRNLLMENVKFPAVVAPNYDVWDLGGNIGQTWIGNDTNTTVSGIVSLTGTLTESNFPTIRTRNITNGDTGLWGFHSQTVKSLTDDAAGEFYSGSNAIMGTIECIGSFAQAWIKIFVYFDGTTSTYEAIATGTKGQVVNAAPTTINIVDGNLGVGIYKSGSSLTISILNRGGVTATASMIFNGVQL